MAINGDNIIEIIINFRESLFLSHIAQVNGINTTQARRLIERKPRSFIALAVKLFAIMAAIIRVIIIIMREENNL